MSKKLCKVATLKLWYTKNASVLHVYGMVAQGLCTVHCATAVINLYCFKTPLTTILKKFYTVYWGYKCVSFLFTILLTFRKRLGIWQSCLGTCVSAIGYCQFNILSQRILTFIIHSARTLDNKNETPSYDQSALNFALFKSSL